MNNLKFPNKKNKNSPPKNSNSSPKYNFNKSINLMGTMLRKGENFQSTNNTISLKKIR